MKGVSLLSDIFLLLALIAVTIMMTMFIWYLILIYEVILTPTGLSTTREVNIRLLSGPAGYYSTMLSFLELNYNNIPMKRIVNAVAIQGKTEIWIEGKRIIADDVIESVLTPMINKDYLLKISPQDIILAQHGDLEKIGIQKVSTELFLLNGEAVELQLLVED